MSTNRRICTWPHMLPGPRCEEVLSFPFYSRDTGTRSLPRDTELVKLDPKEHGVLLSLSCLCCPGINTESQQQLLRREGNGGSEVLSHRAQSLRAQEQGRGRTLLSPLLMGFANTTVLPRSQSLKLRTPVSQTQVEGQRQDPGACHHLLQARRGIGCPPPPWLARVLHWSQLPPLPVKVPGRRQERNWKTDRVHLVP